MQDAPQRPESIPEAAVFSADFDSWELGARDAAGQRGGECCFYRRDGSLYLRSCFVGGVQQGPFAMFHPNGQLAREGTYVEGELDGAWVAYASDGATTLPLRACCVPAGAVKLRAEYRHGQLVRQDFYDAEERGLSADGSVLPERPQSVPAHADFDDLSWRWVVREQRNPVCHVDRFFTAEGALCEELEYNGGQKSARRVFAEGSTLQESSGFDSEGRFHGAFFKRFGPAESSPHADPTIVEVRGQLEHDHPIARFELLDREHRLVRALDFGRAWSGELLSSPALSSTLAPNLLLWPMVEGLRSEGRLREALCLAARAAAREGTSARLEQLLRESTFELKPELRAEQGEALLNDSAARFLGTLDKLLLGAEPAAAYRTLASVIEGAPRVALDLVNASLLLSPSQSLSYLSRGLIRLELGDRDGALADAERVAAVSATGAEFLRDSVRVYYPNFEFWPAKLTLGPAPESAPGEVLFAQPLPAVQRLVRVYATRLLRVRAALQSLLGPDSEPAWLPPDLSRFLPEGPLELCQTQVSIEDETDDGFETSEVEVDERLELPANNASALMSIARANYSALCWLCWAAGLDELEFPTRLEPRPDFPAAVSMSLVRCFRVSDRLKTGGLVSLAKGVPGFSWEGLEVDTLHARFAAVAAEEYLEVRAMFLWSMFEENVSPFQADLRRE